MFAFIKKLKILPKNNKTKGGTMPQTLKRIAYFIISSHCFLLLLLSSKRKRAPGILFDTYKLKIKFYCTSVRPVMLYVVKNHRENKIRVVKMRILC